MIKIVIAVFLACALSLPTWAVPYVSATYEPVDSAYLLRFTVYMDDPIYGEGTGWGLYAVGFSNLIAPDGWQAGMDFRTTAWGAPLPQHYVPAGGVLTGCSATSALLPTQVPYYIAMTGEGVTHFGTLTPVPVPEPSSLLALGGGLVAVGIPWLRRRRR